MDECGVCDSNQWNDCVMDCAGIWGGDSTPDRCGVCGGSDGCVDCAGSAYGVAYLDRVEALQSGHGLVVTHVSEDQERRAVRWLREHDERSYSFVDATSFEVMRQRRLREALAFDGDFAAAGFVHVLP